MAWAQVKYTVFDSSSGTLTFKYGEKPTGGGGITVYDIPDFSRSPEWNSQASSITTVVFDESFKDVRPKKCYCWFQSCSSLTTINGIENLNTEDVTDMDYMFYNCSSLTTLDLSGFNTAKVKYMYKMFFGCSELTTIYASSNFTTSAVTSSDDMFSGCTSLVGAKPFDSNTLDKTYANYQNGYFTYGIKTKDDLAMFANKVNGTYTPAEGETATAYTTICAELMADLTLTDTDVLPAIGSSGYSGTFDGCGHTISGLNFSSTSSALFAQNSGTIKNLGIVEATIAEGANGSFCQTNNGTIESCFFMGTTTGSSQSAGGICQTNNGTITNCYYLADSETDAIEGTTYKTTAQFKSGEVCYLLNGSSPYGEWGQTLSGTDKQDYPVLGGLPVYYRDEVYTNTYGILTIGTQTITASNAPLVWYEFTPSETASYQFSSTQLTAGNLYVNTTKTESDYTDITTSPTYNLEAATTYYVAVSGAPGSYDLTITRINNTPTAIETVTAPQIYAVNGRIVCNGEFRIYDLLGRDVTHLNGSLQGVYVVKTADAAQKVVVR
ncbi:MAG: BspA family leucine-rich repeat surface protein [Bacteroidales bacterium]|nr:BspA family leucine-rich repeat surface protein [Bacteroidales bacterium]